MGSTNAELLAIGRQGFANPVILTAGEQRSGRGRLSRNWSSPPGNLYCSIGLSPDLPIARAAELGGVAALAACDTVSAFALEGEVRIKWPNDILLNGAKVAGLLAESEIRPGTDRVACVVLGIGMNLAVYPPNTPYPTTSLSAETGRTAPTVQQAVHHLGRVLGRLLARWRRSGYPAILRNLSSQMAWRGEMVRVETGQGALTGVALGLDHDGALLLRLENGEQRRIITGDVTVGPRPLFSDLGFARSENG